MTDKSISEAEDADLRQIQAALDRAAKRARDVAIQSGTSLVVNRDGKTIIVNPSKSGNQ